MLKLEKFIKTKLVKIFKAVIFLGRNLEILNGRNVFSYIHVYIYICTVNKNKYITKCFAILTK